MTGVEFVKGHGTENDFVLLPDLGAQLDLTDERVQAICDRRRGLGADGVLRVVAGQNVDEPSSDGSHWFMDYRNADGSIAEMCGNGVRVFAAFLVAAGLARTGEFTIGTRAGPRTVWVHTDGLVTVDMGGARIVGQSTATVAGTSVAGLAIDVGNPHLACALESGLDALDLTVPPGHDSAVFPDGVNVEFIEPHSPGVIRMRVHERGVGETRSCGTGTIAASLAALHRTRQQTGRVAVLLRGGRVDVEIRPDTALLTGPAVLAARGVLAVDWWDRAGG